MDSCEFVIFISTLACSIAKNRSAEEIDLIAAVFTQLGDTLGTIGAREAFCAIQKPDEEK